MKIEIINTGTELLLGSVLNTHLKFIAESLFPLGLRIERQVTVPDGSAIRDAVAETFGRADAVIVTGGLGPTTDDVTREIIAEMLGQELKHDESVMNAITERFARRGLTLSPRNARQAQRPSSATVLPNPHGTAPGLYLPAIPDRNSPHLFLLPGPPRELRPMVLDAVLPILSALAPPAAFSMRIYRIAGMGESRVEELVGEPLLASGIELGYCARPGEVDIRTIGAEAALARAKAIILERLGDHLVTQDGRALEKVIIDLLTERRETLAVAESCTGGFIAHRLTNVPGASAAFLEGCITYANEAKSRTLDVPASLIQQHGAVSSQVAAAMAEGVRRRAGADHGVATTGIAGPDGGSDDKPVGTVFIALTTKHGTNVVERHRFTTDRENFKNLTSQAALDLLRRHLLA